MSLANVGFQKFKRLVFRIEDLGISISMISLTNGMSKENVFSACFFALNWLIIITYSVSWRVSCLKSPFILQTFVICVPL